MAKESKEQRGEEGRGGGGVGEKCTEKLNKFNWRPRFKQRGLFSDRDPSQEAELENRLIELSKSLSVIAQHVPRRYI